MYPEPSFSTPRNGAGLTSHLVSWTSGNQPMPSVLKTFVVDLGFGNHCCCSWTIHGCKCVPKFSNKAKEDWHIESPGTQVNKWGPHPMYWKQNKQNEAAWYQFEFEPISYVHNRICDTPLAKSTEQCVLKTTQKANQSCPWSLSTDVHSKKNIAKKIKPKHTTPQSAVKRHHEFILPATSAPRLANLHLQVSFFNLSNLACCGITVALLCHYCGKIWQISQPPSCHCFTVPLQTHFARQTALASSASGGEGDCFTVAEHHKCYIHQYTSYTFIYYKLL